MKPACSLPLVVRRTNKFRAYSVTAVQQENEHMPVMNCMHVSKQCVPSMAPHLQGIPPAV
jgi:hypothetical protein